MRKSNLLKKYSVLFLMFCMLSISTFYAMPVMTVSASDVQPMSDDIRWRFATISGKKYKRLYNYTTQTWIGDWIPVS